MHSSLRLVTPVALAAFVATFGAAGSAVAKGKLSLKEKKQTAAWDTAFADELKYTNEKCGTKMKAKIDWETFAGTEAFEGKYSVSGYCEPALTNLRYQCEKDEAGKAAVATVKEVVCSYAPRDKRNISLKKGKLTFGTEFDAANADDFVKAYILEELGIAEARAMKSTEEQFLKEIEWTDKKCGTKLEGAIDWKSFQKAKFRETNYSVSGYCDSALGGLESVCSDEDGKQAVQEGVKKVVCSFGGKGKRALKLEKGTLTWTLDWEASNNDDFAKEWLLNNL